RKHAPDHPPDAACVMVIAASRGEGRRDDADPGQSRKDQGQALRRRSRPGGDDRQTAAAVAGLDRAFDEPAVAGAPARHLDPYACDGTRPDRQSAGAAAQPPQGRFRAVKSISVASSQGLLAMTGQKKRPGETGAFLLYLGRKEAGSKASVLLEEARKLLLEARHAPATVQDLLGAAGPGRMRLGIDVEVQLVAFLAPGGTGAVLGAVGHYDRNRMIIRVNFGFHGISFGAPAPVSKCLGYGIWAGL